MKLTQVLALLKSRRHDDALGVLNNDFVGLVNDARGRQLNDAQAAELVQSAALISATITATRS